MGDLTVNVEGIGGFDRGAYVTLRGAIDASTLPLLQERLNGLHRGGCVRFILHLEEVRSIDRGGTTYLLDLASDVRPHGGWIAVVPASGEVKDLLESPGFRPFFRVCDSRQAAVELLHQSSPPVPAAGWIGKGTLRMRLLFALVFPPVLMLLLTLLFLVVGGGLPFGDWRGYLKMWLALALFALVVPPRHIAR